MGRKKITSIGIQRGGKLRSLRVSLDETSTGICSDPCSPEFATVDPWLLLAVGKKDTREHMSTDVTKVSEEGA